MKQKLNKIHTKFSTKASKLPMNLGAGFDGPFPRIFWDGLENAHKFSRKKIT
jgi:hypothetical protein